MTEHRVGQLLDAAAVEIPVRHRTPPLRAIRLRARRRRGLRVVAGLAVVAVAAVGAVATVRGRAVPPPVAAPPVTERPWAWSSGMLDRDGATLTVQVPAVRCERAIAPQARVVRDTGTAVTVTVTGRVLPMDDCSVMVTAVVVVRLAGPLNGRAVVDGATSGPRPVYERRALPDPVPRWGTGRLATSDSVGWYEFFADVDGRELALMAVPRDQGPRSSAVATVPFGPYEAEIVGGSPGNAWTAWWEVGDAVYSVRLIAREGGSITLGQFRRELDRLRWP
jgi:hypothetical protein